MKTVYYCGAAIFIAYIIGTALGVRTFTTTLLVGLTSVYPIKTRSLKTSVGLSSMYYLTRSSTPECSHKTRSRKTTTGLTSEYPHKTSTTAGLTSTTSPKTSTTKGLSSTTSRKTSTTVGLTSTTSRKTTTTRKRLLGNLFSDYSDSYDEIEPLSKKKTRWPSHTNNEEIRFLPDNVARIWPMGIIDYVVDPDSYDDEVAKRILKAATEIMGASCLIFKKVEEPGHRVARLHFTNPGKLRECSHVTERLPNNEIRVVLGYDCLRIRDITHSIMHGLGFKDEVTHPDRDNFVRILWENIQPKYRRLFGVFPEKNRAQVQYDSHSIMHFHDRAFSINGKPTIFPLMPGLNIQPSDQLSLLDRDRLNLAFRQECNHREANQIILSCMDKAGLGGDGIIHLPTGTSKPGEDDIQGLKSEAEHGVYISPPGGQPGGQSGALSDAEEGAYIPKPGGQQVGKPGAISEAEEGVYIPPSKGNGGKPGALSDAEEGAYIPSQQQQSQDKYRLTVSKKPGGVENDDNGEKGKDVSEAVEVYYIPPQKMQEQGEDQVKEKLGRSKKLRKRTKKLIGPNKHDKNSKNKISKAFVSTHGRSKQVIDENGSRVGNSAKPATGSGVKSKSG